MKKITPEYVSSLVNFYPTFPGGNWAYRAGNKDIRTLQVLGTAKIFNLLVEKKIALLADEVGMGKTIQALSVCSALWNQNPKAKVLILTPREEVAYNWIKEYQTFIHHHYRHPDNIVQNFTEKTPVKEMVFCHNLYELARQVQNGWAQLLVGKISSFSSLMAAEKSVERLSELGVPDKKLNSEIYRRNISKEEENNKIASLIKEIIHKNTGDKTPYYFDLLIIDEAHFFRRSESDSLRAQTAKIIFGADGSPLAQRVLLMTATPNHSGSQDIPNILSYFRGLYKGPSETDKILKDICVRRLRRLSEKSKSKYEYREEKALASTFKKNPLAESFFGLYQHDLAQEAFREGDFSGTGNARLWKYLEGLEFFPDESIKYPSLAKTKDEKTGTSPDFHKGSDARILQSLSKEYQKHFQSAPSHPKYESLVQKLSNEHLTDKALIFVRRIKSIYEITHRVIEEFDKKAWTSHLHRHFPELPLKKLDKKTFTQFSSAVAEVHEEDDSQEENLESKEAQENDSIPSSKVLDLFKKVKEEKSTSATNFRLRFAETKGGIFSLLFSPGSDYFAEPYGNLELFRFEVGGKEIENYFISAQKRRLSTLSDRGIAKDLETHLIKHVPIKGETSIVNESIETLLTIFWNIYQSDDGIPEIQKTKLQETYKCFSPYEKEAFSHFLAKGAIFASEFQLVLYDYFLEAAHGNAKAYELYAKVIDKIKSNLKGLRIYQQIQDGITHFRTIYTKAIPINDERLLIKHDWNNFNNAQPVYPYSAANTNKNVLQSFNTPFFPDFLIATSVLQEGVNLQYFCDAVYHYGLAWTPGDNEQRIGRIDRLFGKIERNLDKSEEAKLHIYYPYLKNTVDEEQLGRFVKRKFREDMFIDRGKSPEELQNQGSLVEESEDWEMYLTAGREAPSDPFPATPQDFHGISPPEISEKKLNPEPFLSSIENGILEMKDWEVNVYQVKLDDKIRLIADPKLKEDRKQPVQIALVPDPVGSGWYGEAVCAIKMTTPLGNPKSVKKIVGNFYSNPVLMKHYLPGVKLCYDPSSSQGNHWSLYMSAEIPLFLESLPKNPLSIEEVQIAFRNLVICADLTEKVIFQNQDLSLNDLNLETSESRWTSSSQLRKGNSVLPNPGNWLEEGDFLIQQTMQGSSPISDKDSFVLNHKHHFVKMLPNGKGWIGQVSIPTIDPRKKELELLEKHLTLLNKETM